MMRGMYSAATGMMAQQTNIDNITNNLANVESTAFKQSRVDFQDLLYAHSKDPNTDATSGNQIGMGVRAASTQKIFSQGTIARTGNNFDVAIQGDGFFRVTMPNGEEAYTRDGAFKLDKNGELTTQAGYPIGIKIPKDHTNVQVKPNGEVFATHINEVKPKKIGELKLTRFLNPAGLKALGGSLYKATDVCGAHTTDVPGQNGLGVVAQGFLEKSNVNVVAEMMNIIQAQRAYEMAQKGVQAADEMTRMANQLHKG
ncbi:MAG: flagellar basal-body rod protein FlgG [Vulcanimicrobiota bacterium]